MSWLTQLTDARRNIVHVTPLADGVEHDRSSFGACVCGPRSEAIGCAVQHVNQLGEPLGPRKPHVYGWMFVHNSLDGREAGK